jgi:hypothetical protein
MLPLLEQPEVLHVQVESVIQLAERPEYASLQILVGTQFLRLERVVMTEIRLVVTIVLPFVW